MKVPGVLVEFWILSRISAGLVPIQYYPACRKVGGIMEDDSSGCGGSCSCSFCSRSSYRRAVAATTPARCAEVAA